uniref:Upregulator of cell proliferation n=1 Tax=Mandrillus leucophaeus TaxID=9568 RepID=A0A2K5XE05_MANLE
HSDLGEVAPEIKASERRTAVAIADLEWREMEGDDCEFRYGDGTNEAQDNDFPTGQDPGPRASKQPAKGHTLGRSVFFVFSPLPCTTLLLKK